MTLRESPAAANQVAFQVHVTDGERLITQARSVAAALAHWRDRRGVQMDITAMPGYQELSAPVRCHFCHRSSHRGYQSCIGIAADGIAHHKFGL